MTINKTHVAASLVIFISVIYVRLEFYISGNSEFPAEPQFHAGYGFLLSGIVSRWEEQFPAECTYHGG